MEAPPGGIDVGCITPTFKGLTFYHPSTFRGAQIESGNSVCNLGSEAFMERVTRWRVSKLTLPRGSRVVFHPAAMSNQLHR